MQEKAQSIAAQKFVFTLHSFCTMTTRMSTRQQKFNFLHELCAGSCGFSAQNLTQIMRIASYSELKKF